MEPSTSRVMRNDLGGYRVGPHELRSCPDGRTDSRPDNKISGSEAEAKMRHQKRNAIALFVLGVILCAIQAVLWARETAPARSETDKQNIEQRRSPNEMAGVAGTFLLIAAGVVASIPRRPLEH